MIKKPYSKVRIHVGNRIRIFRKLARFTQKDLGKKLDMSFQQLQKYERGEDRINIDLLWKFSQFFNVSIVSFFEDLDASEPQLFDLNMFTDKKYTKNVFRMVEAYCRLNDKTRESLCKLIESLTEE